MLAVVIWIGLAAVILSVGEFQGDFFRSRAHRKRAFWGGEAHGVIVRVYWWCKLQEETSAFIPGPDWLFPWEGDL